MRPSWEAPRDGDDRRRGRSGPGVRHRRPPDHPDVPRAAARAGRRGARRAAPLADWGTGSGVLAIAAAKLGFGPVVGLRPRAGGARGGRRRTPRRTGSSSSSRASTCASSRRPSAPTVVANLTAPLLREVAAAPRASARAAGLLRAARRGGRRVAARVRRARADRAASRSEGDWIGDLVRGGSPAEGRRDGQSGHERRALVAADRRLRLGDRRAHGAARAPGLAARGGLPLPRRHARASPTGRSPVDWLRPRIDALDALPARPRGQAAGDRLQLGDLGGAADGAREVAAERGVEVLTVVDPEAEIAAAITEAGASACSRRRPRSRAAPTGAPSSTPGPRARRDRGGRPGPGADHPERLPVRRARDRHRALLLRAAEAGRRRHPDPRLHPLSARRPDAAADAGPRRAPGHRRATRSPRPLSGCSRRSGLEARERRRGRVPLPVHRRGRMRSASWAPASCRCRSARSSGSSSMAQAPRSGRNRPRRSAWRPPATLCL